MPTTAKKTARKVRYEPVLKLPPLPYEQFLALKDNIAVHGVLVPILVDSDAGIIAGHGRLLGAQALKLKEVPVIVLDHLTPAQRKAYLIADNKLVAMSRCFLRISADAVRVVASEFSALTRLAP